MAANCATVPASEPTRPAVRFSPPRWPTSDWMPFARPWMRWTLCCADCAKFRDAFAPAIVARVFAA